MRNTYHVETRKQQRGIKDEEVQIMLEYGKCSYSRNGISYAMDKKSRQKAKRELGESKYERLASKLNIYVICSLDGEAIITAAYRLKKRKRR